MTARDAGAKTTVLLVENGPVVRTGVATVLNEAGFDVIATDNIPGRGPRLRHGLMCGYYSPILMS